MTKANLNSADRSPRLGIINVAEITAALRAISAGHKVDEDASSQEKYFITPYLQIKVFLRASSAGHKVDEDVSSQEKYFITPYLQIKVFLRASSAGHKVRIY